MASNGLRERLEAAKLAGTRAPTNTSAWTYRFRSNEGAATVALEVVAAWLRDEAAKDRPVQTTRDTLLALARSLDGEQGVTRQYDDETHDPAPVEYTPGSFGTPVIVHKLEDVWQAPFTPVQVLALNKWQRSGKIHPYTCGNDSSHPPLVAITSGWTCLGCDYTQAWARAIAEPGD